MRTSEIPIASTRLLNAVPYDESRSRSRKRGAVPRKCFGHLTRQPARGRTFGDIEADNLAAVVGQDEHHEQEPECCGRHDKHVDGGDADRLVAQEATPSRRRRVLPAQHILRDGGLTDLDTKLEQLTVDARRTPERIGQAHVADQFASFTAYWPSPRPGPPTPVEPKALAMPLDHGGRLHQHHQVEAPRPHSIEPDPHQPIDGAQLHAAALLPMQDRHLLTKRDEL
jgi:hypothetical protein